MLKRLIPAIIFVIALTLINTPGTVSAKEQGEKVSGVAVNTLYFTNCPSPIGLCGAGTISGGINGTTVGILYTQKAITKNGVTVAYLYTGTFDVTSANNSVLHGFTITQIDASNDNVHSTVYFHGGTGQYRHTFGTINLTGTPPGNDQAEHYTYVGFLTHDN